MEEDIKRDIVNYRRQKACDDKELFSAYTSLYAGYPEERSAHVVDEIVCRMKKGAFYSPLYSLSASKHGQAFAGFKSWCPTISARGKIRFNSRNSASNEAFCSRVRVSAGQLAASSPPS